MLGKNHYSVEMNLFPVVDIGKNHYSVVIEQPLGSLYVNFKDI